MAINKLELNGQLYDCGTVSEETESKANNAQPNYQKTFPITGTSWGTICRWNDGALPQFADFVLSIGKLYTYDFIENISIRIGIVNTSAKTWKYTFNQLTNISATDHNCVKQVRFVYYSERKILELQMLNTADSTRSFQVKISGLNSAPMEMVGADSVPTAETDLITTYEIVYKVNTIADRAISTMSGKNIDAALESKQTFYYKNVEATVPSWYRVCKLSGNVHSTKIKVVILTLFNNNVGTITDIDVSIIFLHPGYYVKFTQNASYQQRYIDGIRVVAEEDGNVYIDIQYLVNASNWMVGIVQPYISVTNMNVEMVMERLDVPYSTPYVFNIVSNCGVIADRAKADVAGNDIAATYVKKNRATRIHYISEEGLVSGNYSYGDTIVVDQDVTAKNFGVENFDWIVKEGKTLTIIGAGTVDRVRLILIEPGGTVSIPNGQSAPVEIEQLVIIGSGNFSGAYSACIRDFVSIDQSRAIECADLYGTVTFQGLRVTPAVIANTISANLRCSSFYAGWFKVYVEGCVYTTKGPQILEASS